MNAWPFILAAYAVTAAAVLTLVGWSWAAMRKAEQDVGRLGRDA